MSENKTEINDLPEGSASLAELSEHEMGSISGGLRLTQGGGDGPERLPVIETIHSDGRVTMDIL